MTDKTQKALKLALEALEIGHEYAVETAEHFHIEMAGYKQHRHDAMDAEVKQIADAITAIREALAKQPAQQQEPVACVTYKEVADTMNALWAGTLEQVQIAEEMKDKKLYTSPMANHQGVNMKLKWQQAPVKTQWGDEMVVASVAIDKDHTVDLYCEQDQIAKVDAMFAQPSKPWVGLTDEEVDECYYWKGRQWTTDELVRHVEAKLREKNNG